MAENFAAGLAKAYLITKTDFDNNLIDLNRKIVSNKTKNVVIENELNELKAFDSSYFEGKGHFEDDDTQNLKDCLIKVLNLLLHLRNLLIFT